VALAPALAGAWTQRGSLLKDMGRNNEAASAFERALELGADGELNRFFLASLGTQASPATAPRAYVQALFDDYADGFDQHLVDVLGYQAHRQLITRLAGLQSQPFDSALDLGCGTGLCGPLLRPIVQQLTGVDLSQTAIDMARKNFELHGLTPVELRVANAEALPYADATFDHVYGHGVIQYTADPAQLIRECHRVLKPGGTGIFMVYNRVSWLNALSKVMKVADISSMP